MSAAPPEPKRPDPAQEDPEAAELDQILASINKLVDHQCKKAAAREATPGGGIKNGRPRPPTDKKTRMAFQALSQSSLDLGDSSESMPVIPDDDDEDDTPVASMLRPTTWFRQDKKSLG